MSPALLLVPDTDPSVFFRIAAQLATLNRSVPILLSWQSSVFDQASASFCIEASKSDAGVYSEVHNLDWAILNGNNSSFHGEHTLDKTVDERCYN